MTSASYDPPKPAGEPEAHSAREVGGKVLNLSRLRDFGFRVPPWVVVPSRVFEEVVGARRGEIQSLLDAADFNDFASVERASARIGEIAKASELPGPFCRDLLAALGERFGADALFSVRSSAVGEDAAEHSFAGQMDSFLNVPLGAVPDAVRKVWASAFSPRVLVYRRRKGL